MEPLYEPGTVGNRCGTVATQISTGDQLTVDGFLGIITVE